MESERAHHQLEKQNAFVSCSGPNIILKLARFGECCANNPFKFGISKSVPHAHNCLSVGFARGCVSRSVQLHSSGLQMIQRSTNYPIKNGSAGYLPGIGIGHDRPPLRTSSDLSLENISRQETIPTPR